MDAETGGWFPITFEDPSCQPTCAVYHNSDWASERGLYFGCLDGLVRKFSRLYGADLDSSLNSAPIHSSVTIGPIRLGPEGTAGRVDAIRATMAEVVTLPGLSTSSLPDASGRVVSWALKLAHSPQILHTHPSQTASGEWRMTATGMPMYPERPRRVGVAASLTLSSVSRHPWAVEEIHMDVAPAGIARLP